MASDPAAAEAGGVAHRLLLRVTDIRPGEARALALAVALTKAGVTKYNLGGALPELPSGRRILVPGQVEDDASIRLGARAERSNLALLTRARAEFPDAVLIYKPHPDVEAGLRPGRIDPERLAGLARPPWRPPVPSCRAGHAGIGRAASEPSVSSVWK